MYLPEDVWGIVKEFMLDWRESWHRRLKTNFEAREIKEYKCAKGSIWKNNQEVGIKSQLPIQLINERYVINTGFYRCTFRVPYNYKTEVRICTLYNRVDWLTDHFMDYNGCEWRRN